MPESPVYRPHAEPAARVVFPQAGDAPDSSATARAFEFVSRGDFVNGHLLLPESTGTGPVPLILATSPDGRSAELDGARFAREGIQRGFAVAAIDLPLHGRRASPKLSERLFLGLDRLMSGADLDPDSLALVEEFGRQSTSDLIRAAEALGDLPEIDPQRAGVLGVGVGAVVSAYALGNDDRLKAGVLALADARMKDGDLDPAAQLSKRRGGATCPIFCQGLGDETCESAQSTGRTLYDRAGDPKQWARFEGVPAELSAASAHRSAVLPKDAADAALDFFAKVFLS